MFLLEPPLLVRVVVLRVVGVKVGVHHHHAFVVQRRVIRKISHSRHGTGALGGGIALAHPCRHTPHLTEAALHAGSRAGFACWTLRTHRKAGAPKRTPQDGEEGSNWGSTLRLNVWLIASTSSLFRCLVGFQFSAREEHKDLSRLPFWTAFSTFFWWILTRPWRRCLPVTWRAPRPARVLKFGQITTRPQGILLITFSLHACGVGWLGVSSTSKVFLQEKFLYRRLFCGTKF